jgi:hypothetical protein
VGGSWTCGEFGHARACGPVVSRDWTCWGGAEITGIVCLRGPACHLPTRDAARWWPASATDLEVVNLSEGGFGAGTTVGRSAGSCIEVRKISRKSADLSETYLV